MKQAHDACIEFARCAGRTAKPTPSDRESGDGMPLNR